MRRISDICRIVQGSLPPPKISDNLRGQIVLLHHLILSSLKQILSLSCFFPHYNLPVRNGNKYVETFLAYFYLLFLDKGSYITLGGLGSLGVYVGGVCILKLFFHVSEGVD